MDVEWVGGEKDGEVIRVPDHFREIVIPLSADILFRGFDPPPDNKISTETLVLPIVRRNGKFYIHWSERRRKK